MKNYDQLLALKYWQERNFYNSLQASKNSIRNGYSDASYLSNISEVYTELGLQKYALNTIDESIQKFEKMNFSRIIHAETIYIVKAELMRMKGDLDKVTHYIEKAISIFRGSASAYVELSKLHIQQGEIDKGLEYMNKAINVGSHKFPIWLERASLFLILGENNQAILDFEKANQISKNKTISLYELGKAYYINRNFNKAKICYETLISKGFIRDPYQYSIYSIGIVQFIDVNKGFGFVQMKTWYNNHDSVYFNTSNCKVIPNKGDKIRCMLKYKLHKNEFNAIAYEVEPYNMANSTLKNNIVYHGIIHRQGNSFKSVTDLNYIEIYYPVNFILPYSAISHIVGTKKIIGKLRIAGGLKEFEGFSFVELHIDVDENNLPKILSYNGIPQNNIYADKSINKIEKKIKTPQFSESIFLNTCYLCGGNEWCGTDGCPWDPS